VSTKEVAALARVLCFNWEHLEVLDLATCGSLVEYQEKLLGARVDEDKDAAYLEVQQKNSRSALREVRILRYKHLRSKM
jgi:hypothetical protein